MALHLESLSIAASIVSVLVFIFNGTRATLSISRLFEGKTKAIQSPLLHHEDEDGVSTKASVKAFSDTWQRVVVALLSAIGCYCTLSLVIITLIQYQSILLVSFWQLVANSIVLCLEGIAFLIEPSSIKRYNLAISAFWTSNLTIVLPCIKLISFSGYRISQAPQIYPEDVSTWILTVQIAAASLRGLCCIFIPRRPNVYYAGQVVDQEFSTCLFGRFTYRWVNGLLQYTVQNRSLGIENLPQLPFSGRVENLLGCFEQVRQSRRLWKAILVAHWRPLVLQYLLGLAQSLLSFGSQVALYGILKSLEQRSSESWSWLCTAALGLFLVLGSCFDSWLWWLIYSKLAIPVYQELTALVFTKAMRCEDVAKQSIGDHDDEYHDNKGRQSTTNLAVVDARRVSEFFLHNYLLSVFIAQMFMSCTFLLSLVGWRSLLAGLAVGGLAMPLNAYATKRYWSTQEELMKATDRRTRLVTEVLQGVRQIKFSAMEQQWQDRISEKRNAELRMLWKTSLYNSLMVFIWTSIPVLLSSASLSVYALVHGNLTSSVAFTAISVFGTLEFMLSLLPDLFKHWMEAKVSVDRIDTYLQLAEKAPHTTDVDCISFDDAKIAWSGDDDGAGRQNQLDFESRFVLTNLTLRLPPKGLSVITGKTGSGKSLLLSSILGECNVLEGSVKVPSAPSPDERYDEQATCANWIIDAAVAYVAQNPWIENGTIRQNILFGLPFDRTRYSQVLFAVGLERDLNMFPDGDMTDIGANGVNLSGGQRWRISLARALYSRAGILVMDDVFSALDAYTGRHVYQHALTGPLGQGRTRVLVTHHVGLCLPQTDYCILLANGTMKDAGTVERLMDRGSLTHVLQEATAAESDDNKVQDVTVKKNTNTALRHGRSSSISTVSTVNSHSRCLAETEASPRKFTADEERETGSISLSVYASYIMRNNQPWLWALSLLGYVLYMVLTVVRSWWLNVWTNESNAHLHPTHPVPIMKHGVTHTATVQTDSDLPFYLGTYIAISIAICVIGTVRYLALMIAAIASCRRLFHDLLTPVLRAPVRWLDTVPLGRILTRLTSDMYVLDSELGPELSGLVNKFMQILGILIAAAMMSPLLLVFACLPLVCCLQISHSYVAGAREMKRLENVTKSPVLELLGSSVSGLLTIRAFGKTQAYIDRMYSLIDCNARASWNVWLFSRWFGFRIIFMGAVFTTATAALVVYDPSMSASMAGFALSFALQFNLVVSLTMRIYASLEMDMNSTERVLEYTTLETEAQAGLLPPAGWPTHGRIEVKDLVVGYAPELPPVLNGLSFRVEENQRVGVGQIFIDGVDIARLSLHGVRSRLAIIPQEPVLFSGTLRSNLDPFDEHTDLELYNALERVHLLSSADTITLPSQSTSNSTITSSSDVANIEKTSNMFSSLSSPISEGGANLSQGQRQLLCLARAIVSQPMIMILDEATSAVDMETDGLIQQSIRAEFGRNASSLLVIAHRLSTIADFDRILVMDAGRAVEFGTPRELLEIESSVFKTLVESSGEKAVVEQIIYSA